MKIGILGSGEVGRKLAAGCIDLGHHVMIGTRNPAKEEIRKWIDNTEHKENACVGSFAEAATFGELIIISTLWGGTENAINMAISSNFNDKIVVDTTNPLEFAKDVPPKLSLGYDKSAGEIIQSMLPNSKVVKAFNIVGNPHMVHPDFPGGPPTMFICGNFKDAKNQVVEKLLIPFGWESIDIGGIEQSRLLEPLAMLWITYYIETGSGNHAFKLLKK
ncbi:NADPH-dependent F420 reductase [Candidatus Nitrosocosmicus arcticus]|uniref:Putative coenzyme F420-dependent NADP reductase n=1 Tax=Candidatus Nitrosocosmicus arcticus TaxID=2035267 RepID=A0A557SZC9_9ARCH|nr:NAD(P)-binding domain-containing protein [Candidatus Nitrosocosmicus arcticus]TVP41962.1 putative coenzyme F420-dependent NADP reductase [Candidatus Nitrosocosmicus arcticus]